VVTDKEGKFSIGDLDPGMYSFGFSDAAATVAASVTFDVPPEKAPAALRGVITLKHGDEADLVVEGDLEPYDGPGDDPGDEVVLKSIKAQRKWNRKWVRSKGWSKVTIRGKGLDSILGVALSSATGGPLYADHLKIGSKKVKAYFRKSDIVGALVAPDAKKMEVTVSVTTPAGTQDFTNTIKVVGKP
jgi:hypothetical protein